MSYTTSPQPPPLNSSRG
uniref:Uncharacterized protein n=1 Tax=Anguilla anguilla TaxID=7936 RepID=A0A0E9U4H0_ANGAN